MAADRQDQNGRVATADAATVDLAPRVAFLGGSDPRLSNETDALRQVRLRAAALFLFVVLGISLAWGLVFGADSLWPLHAAVVAAMGAALALLSVPRPIGPRGLRVLEVAIFGLAAAYLAKRQYHGMLLWSSSRGDAASLVATVEGALANSILLMFAYCMLIPNTWRAAARVVLAIAALPIAVDLTLVLAHPEVIRRARQVATFEKVSDNFWMMSVAAGLSIYGTHVINSLRREAFEARQLNQYRLGRRLGTGGMGEVYLAEHRLLKRPCALKLIRPDNAADARALARFEREVRATARLSHPNTVEIYDYGHTDDGTFYYVMEYLPGLSLDELVGRHGPLPAGRVVYLLRQACEALAEAHAAGLIHRDIKPANIIAARRGGRYDVAKLLDFGLVKEAGPAAADRRSDELSGEGTIRGTLLYMAPEQVTGDRPLDGRCDLYALGAVAYHLLTGQPPFGDLNAARLIVAHARDPVVPPSRLRPEVPGDLERVVLRCLAKEPADRYPDADELGCALAACADAGRWDARRAESWWREVEPGATTDPAS